MDSVSMSAGGRLANIHMHKERRRKLTSMVNDLETKRLNTIKKQIQNDEIAERNIYERKEKKIFKSNDEFKAFQKALLHRITTVKETSRLAGGIRPLINLGRYGGATIDQIKTESEKFKPIRNPEQRRMIKTKILLEQGKRDGRIKQFDSSILGDVAESILNLEKVSHASKKLEGVNTETREQRNEEEVETSNETPSQAPPTREKVVVRRRQLVLPPLQVSRSMHPNMNYYRQISAEHRKIRSDVAQSSTTERLLNEIPEEYRKPVAPKFPKRKRIEKEVTSSDASEIIRVTSVTRRQYRHFQSKQKTFEWDYSKTLAPVTIDRHLSENQRFWRPGESIVARHHQKIVLPRIA